MVSVAGIEPTLERPKRSVIPFHHTEKFVAGDQGFEPRNAGIKIRCLRPTWRNPKKEWWTVRESNSQSRLAKPMLSHLTNSPVERGKRIELSA